MGADCRQPKFTPMVRRLPWGLQPTLAPTYAVITGSNKGIGLEICKQLASQGVTVVLTARDDKRGLDAIEKLQGFGLSDFLLFHQLDVTGEASIASFARFIHSRFGKLDILINNAGVGGTLIEDDDFKALSAVAAGSEINWGKLLIENYDLALACVKTNYYGAKQITEALLPFLHLSSSPTIVNVSSATGKLKNVGNEWAKGVLNDVENLTQERIDEVLNEFLRDFEKGSLESKGWPQLLAAYTVSKAALNGYTRILAKKNLSFRVNSVCPGYVRTDLNYRTGVLTVEEGAECAVMTALLPRDGPSGLFFVKKEVSSFEE